MRLSALTACATLLAALPLAVLPLSAQSFSTHPCHNDSDHDGMITRWMTGEQACEMRTTTFPLVDGHLKVLSQNGGIEVIGEDRSDIALEATVTARAGSHSEAESILHEITIDTGATVQARGPHTSGWNRNWGVGFKLLVPHRLAGLFHTDNGGLSLSALNGDIQGETTNGGLHFDNLAGNVHLTTTNGGIHATLSGPTWQGTGLTASTTNGGVSVNLPANYSAHLLANTTNGGLSLDVPNANQSGVHHHSIDTNLGSGGPTISFETTNGGVSIH